jgi:hypothetical protein
MRILILLLLLSGTAARAADFVDSFTGLRFPDMCGQWKKLEVEHYEDPKLGFSVSYNTPEKYALTVYVYQGAHAEIPNGGSALAYQEMIYVTGGVRDGWSERGGTVQPLLEISELKDDKLPGVFALMAAQTIKLNGRESISLSGITGYKNRLVKVRFTRPKVETATAFRELSDFVLALLRSNADGLDPFFKPCLPDPTAKTTRAADAPPKP